MPTLHEFRVRTVIPDSEVEEIKGKIVTDDYAGTLIQSPRRVYKPNGQLLCHYLQGVLDPKLLQDSYEVLHSLRKFETQNRGLASGTKRTRQFQGGRTYSAKVPSKIIGTFEGEAKVARELRYCRLTAWSGQEWDQYATLFPLFQAIGKLFQENVGDRYEAQMAQVRNTHPEWVIKDTPFTTITVNNSWATGVHVDDGDLEEGFSCLAVLRYGEYDGGYLTFPRYGLGVNMRHGDLLLMDAHEWHANTKFRLPDGSRVANFEASPERERISIVCYFRTKMVNCGSAEEERTKQRELLENISVSGFQPSGG